MKETSPVPEESEDLRTVLDRMGDGFFAVDTEWHITYVNDEGETVLRTAMADDVLESADSIVGLPLWESIPDAVGTTFYDRYHEAMETQEPVSFDAHYEPLSTWFDVRVFPSASGISVYLRDVTEQRLIRQQNQQHLDAVQQLYAVSADSDTAFEEKLTAVLELGCSYLGVEDGFLTRIDDQVHRIEAATAANSAVAPGDRCSLNETYCRTTLKHDGPWTVTDALAEGYEGDPAYEQTALRSYIGSRVEVTDELYGTLCFADTDPREQPFTDLEETFVELLTRWVSYELERRAAQSALEEERDKLDEFASVISHDLRNPLNVASGRLALLDAACESEHIDPIERSLTRMEALITDMLTLARSGASIETTEPVDLDAVAHDAWATVTTAAATLTVDLDASTVRADNSRLRQLLENLFRNSIEHGSTSDQTDSTATDPISVRVCSLPEANGFAVEDDGDGIPASERDRVFEAGYTTHPNGTGFGLRIVTEIATAHGWEVTVTESRDGGARFVFQGVNFDDT